MLPIDRKNTTIASMLANLLKTNETLNVVISYKGLLIAQNVRLLSISEDQIIIQSPARHICANIREHIFLNIPNTPKGIKAKVQEVNLSRGIMKVSDFSLFGSDWQERVSDRVAPAIPIRATLIRGRERLIGRLDNLSNDGLGILLYTRNQKRNQKVSGEKTKVEITLNQEVTLHNQEAEVVYSRPVGSNLTQIGLMIQPRGRQKTEIAKYILARKQRILLELERSSSSLLDPRCSKDLYF